MRIDRLLGAIYLAIGLWGAATRDYLENLDSAKRILSAVLAILLWPLVLLGVDFRLN